jgi:hypothetical protein
MGEATLFHHVRNIERPLASIQNFATGLAIIGETLGDEGAVVQGMSWAISDLVKKIDEEQSALFKLTHPDRIDLSEKVGQNHPIPTNPNRTQTARRFTPAGFSLRAAQRATKE